MTTDPLPYILVAAAVSALIAWAGTVAWYRPRLRRHHTDAWNQARVFYTRRENPDQRHL